MKSKWNFAPMLVAIGAFFILVNTLCTAAFGQPIILSSYPVSSVKELQASTALWMRVVFGFPGIVEGVAIVPWIFLAVFNFLIALLLLVKPGKNMTLKYLGLILSLLSIAVGGGFIFGLVMCFIGYLIGLQPDLPFEETFIGKMYRAARIDSTFLDSILGDKSALQTGVLALIFVNVLTGIGMSLYSYNVDLMVRSSENMLFRILFLGEIFVGSSIANTVYLNIGFAIIKWVIFSLIIYVFGVLMLGSSAKYEDVAKVVAFAYVPVCLQIFVPLVFVWPWISFEWPFIVAFLTNFWFFVILVAGLKVALDVSVKRVLGVAILSGSVYWVFNNRILSSFVSLPGMRFLIEPIDIPVLIVSTSALLAVLLGVFKRYVSV